MLDFFEFRHEIKLIFCVLLRILKCVGGCEEKSLGVKYTMNSENQRMPRLGRCSIRQMDGHRWSRIGLPATSTLGHGENCVGGVT